VCVRCEYLLYEIKQLLAIIISSDPGHILTDVRLISHNSAVRRSPAHDALRAQRRHFRFTSRFVNAYTNHTIIHYFCKRSLSPNFCHKCVILELKSFALTFIVIFYNYLQNVTFKKHFFQQRLIYL